MHAYLIVGDKKGIERQIESLTNKYLAFSVKKIEDARNLINFVRLSSGKEEFILLENIDEATPEASNSLLKTLEEPRENIKFILTAKSPSLVLPTILSRCTVIRTNTIRTPGVNEDIGIFFRGDIRTKTQIIDGEKDRQDAKLFLEDALLVLKTKLEKSPENPKLLKVIKLTNQTLVNILANCNPFIQLNAFAINVTELTKPETS
jgi:DNA polymerase III delta prime subunit